ncbi:MAG: triose-phosphate isomerase [Candidatus Diapherotrites archaeon]|nr:triose-phosphate isomerase [Candidatus Diapherotrites archaeon]
MGKPLIIANWKMNFSVLEAESFAEFFVKNFTVSNVEPVIAPSFVFLQSVSSIFKSKVSLAAQNVSEKSKGSFTGEVSVDMVKPFCKYVLVGHSERRQFFSESNVLVAEKTLTILSAGLIPVICVGESADDHKWGKRDSVLLDQIQAVLKKVPQLDWSKLIFAYEPVWAIGSGQTPSVPEIEDAVSFIQKITLNHQQVLYGGSVSSKNAKEILSISLLSGLLVGSASLNVKEFLEILRIASNLRK